MLKQTPKIRLDGYLLLGFIDKDFNTLIYSAECYSHARSAAPAFGISLTHKF